MTPKRSHQSRQEGSVLLVAVIFLLLFTVMAMSVYRSSVSSVQALGNMQWRAESINAANDAIDRLLSDPNTFTNAATIGATLNATPITLDVNGDGNPDIRVKFKDNTGPECKRAVPIPNTELDVDAPEDIACMSSGAANNTGLGVTASSTTGTGTSAVTSYSTSGIAQLASSCANVEWSMKLEAEDAVTNTKVDVVQGVGVRVPLTSVTGCD